MHFVERLGQCEGFLGSPQREEHGGFLRPGEGGVQHRRRDPVEGLQNQRRIVRLLRLGQSEQGIDLPAPLLLHERMPAGGFAAGQREGIPHVAPITGGGDGIWQHFP